MDLPQEYFKSGNENSMYLPKSLYGIKKNKTINKKN